MNSRHDSLSLDSRFFAARMLVAQWDEDANGQNVSSVEKLLCKPRSGRFAFRCSVCTRSSFRRLSDALRAPHAPCSVCRGRTVVAGVNDCATTNPGLASRFDSSSPIRPEDVTEQSNRSALFVCSHGHEFTARISAVRNSTRECCSVCRNLKVVSGVNDMATVAPSLAMEYSPRNDADVDQVSAGGGVKRWFLCVRCGGEDLVPIRS